MSNDAFAAKSAELGLQKLAQQYPMDLQKALENGASLANQLPKDLHWTEEPAHTFNLTPKVEVKA